MKNKFYNFLKNMWKYNNIDHDQCFPPEAQNEYAAFLSSLHRDTPSWSKKNWQNYLQDEKEKSFFLKEA